MSVGAAQVEPRVTADEFLSRAAQLGRVELVDGRIVEMAPTGWTHGKIEVRLARVLDEFIEEHGAGVVVCGEVGYRLGELDVRAADVAVHLQPPGDDEVFPTTMPALVVEVISPSESWTDVEAKVAQYLEAGVREVWLADPTHQTVTSRRPDGHTRVFHQDDVLTTDVLPGFEAPLERVFR